MSEEAIRTILGAFLFSGDDSDKKVKVLSGGEKSRLILAKLLINPPNFLLLDEPTTHLDVDAVDALIRALNEYQGTMVFISHDIYFVRSVANTVYEVKGGRVRKFPGNFDYYLQKKDSAEDLTLISKRKPLAHEYKKNEDAPKEDIVKKEGNGEAAQNNKYIAGKINKLAKEREKLNLEMYAKRRALSESWIYREDETVKAYNLRLEEIEKRQEEIIQEIRRLKAQKI